ncbi:MAG: SDR family oxidoreductase [Dehalococcoidales bacterium]|nr:SDR family oxidoreductase [Dehalococcoidales bacterium]
MKDLEGKVAFITGGASGIGLGIAKAFVKYGMKVVIADKRQHALDEAMAYFKPLGKPVHPVQLDVTDRDDYVRAADEAERVFGRIHVLVNNAGVTSPDSFVQMTYKRWRLILSVNLDGVFLCTKAVLPHMLERKSGMVINVSSILAHQIRMNIAYGVTKAGVERFTMGLAREMRREPGIAITCIRPYFVKTEVVLGFMEGRDTSDFEDPIIWQKYTAMLAACKPEEVTGKIFDRAALEEKFGKISG